MFHRQWSAAIFGVTCLLTLLSAPGARAQVIEPNGVSVPGVSSNPSEVTVQSYFTQQGEMIDAVKEASTEPGTFSPLCDFEAALVLSESSAKAGIAWYNVPATATGAPSAVYMIVPPGTAVGQVISSGDIRSNASYAGGQVGFVLVKDGVNVYYSEYRRNQLCSKCTAPDYWKMALVYRSKKLANTFYLAFEDWEGANDSSWLGNDGDFNDKVFRITGVSCPGGGQPCDTGLPGVCAPGLTECQAGGKLLCKQQVMPVAEKCDGLDTDCDGAVDNGDLCAADEVCDKGHCVKKCGEVLFTCSKTEICNAGGYCVDAKCADVTCTGGLVCVDGACKSPCDGVKCPAPQVCRVGRCVDPCAGVTCEKGRVCNEGVCVLGCGCSACDSGNECAASGSCVEQGCKTQTCAAGTTCKAGQCVDSCLAAACPAGEKCALGACVDACTGVSCDAGQKCLAGSCADSCSDIQCGPGFKCVPGASNAGECVDACQGVDCGAGKKCQNGTCGSSCIGVTCAGGEVCNAGVCMNPCAAITCPVTAVCRAGVCIDRCEGVMCPSAQHCDSGVCVTDVVTVPQGGSPATGGSVGSGGAGSGGVVSGSGGSSSAGAGEAGHRAGNASPGCGCRVQPSRSSSWAVVLALSSVLAAARRRRRRA
jgi:MYXO-CTERM domain-containing protein